MARRAVITGMGVITPIGNTLDEYCEGLLAGKSGIAQISLFDASQYPSRIAGEVKNFDPVKYMDRKRIPRMDRFAQFAIAAAVQAIEDSGLDISKEDPYRIGVVCGTGIGGLKTLEREVGVLLSKGPSRVSPFFIPMLITNISPGEIAIRYGFKGPNYSVSSACASSSHAIGDALRLIREGKADVIISGGSEAAITPIGLAGFCSLKALSTRNDDPAHASRPFDKERDGFIMSEGAGILVIEELQHARARGARILAELAGYGATDDAYHITAPDPSGEAPADSMKIAIKDAGLNPDDIDYVNAHGTSTQLNDKSETLAIKKVFGEHAHKLAISSTKSMVGHMLGAAGAAEIIASILCMNKGMVHATVNYQVPDPDCDLDYVPNNPRKMEVDTFISNSLGFGGHNATLVVRRYAE